MSDNTIRVRADNPIETLIEDKLGRDHFATSLAEAIAGWDGTGSLVIGLNGRWGDGKTSVVNMAQDWAKLNSLSIHFLHFNPWQFESHKDLTAAFFRELSIGIRDAWGQSKTVKTLWHLWRYASRIKGPTEIFDTLATVFKSIGVLLVFLGLGSPLLPGYFTNASVGLLGLGALILVCARVLAISLFTIANRLKLPFFSEADTLEASKDRLAASLLSRKSILCVVIDDLDRLEPNEVREVLRLVRSNADFPHVVYLLSLDVALINKHFTQDVGDRHFLEKIIQLHLDLPTPHHTRYLELFHHELNNIIASHGITANVDEQRWWDVQAYFESRFNNARDVHRVLILLSFQLGHFLQAFDADIDIRDLASLCALAVMDPEFYDTMPALKPYLLNEFNFVSDDEVKTHLTRALDSIDEPHRESLSDLVAALFPTTARFLKVSSSEAKDYGRWGRERRVCHPDYFDRYFEFNIARQLATSKEVLIGVGNPKDGEEYLQMLKDVLRRGALRSFVDQSQEAIAALPLEKKKAMLLAVSDLSESVSHESGELFGFSNARILKMLAVQILSSIDDPSARRITFEEIFSRSSGVWIPLVVVAENDPVLNSDRRSDRFLFGDDIESLRELAREKIRAIATKGGLAVHPRLLWILYRWKEWTNIDEPRNWMKESLNNSTTFAAILNGIGTFVRSTGGNRWEMHLQQWAPFCSASEFEGALERLDPTIELSERQRSQLDALRTAIAERGTAD